MTDNILVWSESSVALHHSSNAYVDDNESTLISSSNVRLRRRVDHDSSIHHDHIKSRRIKSDNMIGMIISSYFAPVTPSVSDDTDVQRVIITGNSSDVDDNKSIDNRITNAGAIDDFTIDPSFVPVPCQCIEVGTTSNLSDDIWVIRCCDWILIAILLLYRHTIQLVKHVIIWHQKHCIHRMAEVIMMNRG